MLDQRFAGAAFFADAHPGPAAGAAGGIETPVEVPIEAVQPGDRLEVLAGESVPADGRVVDGRSALNQALLTGESRPASVGPGDWPCRHRQSGRPAGGPGRRGGRAHPRGPLMQLVARHSRSRAPVVQLADRVAGYFVVVVIGLAMLTLGLWLWREPSRAVTMRWPCSL